MNVRKKCFFDSLKQSLSTKLLIHWQSKFWSGSLLRGHSTAHTSLS